jgi:YD repeat-containing protein
MSRWTLLGALERRLAGRRSGPNSFDRIARPDRAPLARRFILACALCASILTAGAALAATATYGYDALGRLTSVTYDDGKLVIYRLDAAGNRTQVLSVAPPASITVPASNTTGSYAIGWSASAGAVTAYKLYESTNAGFSGQTLVYSGTALSASITGKLSGTYYYRVTACVDTTCSGYRAGANGVVVTR